MRRRRGIVWALLFVAVLVNLPIGHHYWSEWRLHRSGVQTNATVVRADVLKPDTDDPHYLVQFRFAEEVDPDQSVWPVDVEAATYRAAEASMTIPVTVLPGHPSVYDVEGTRRSAVGWIVLLGVDGVLVLVALLLARAGRIGRLDVEDDPDGDRPDQSRPF